MNVELKNQVALVTGASRGMGRSISLALAEAGAHVILAARNEDRLQKVKEEIIVKGGLATPLKTDISVEQEIISLFETIKENCGRLDIVVNNAGIGIWGKLVDFAIEDFDKLINVNLRSMYICCQQALKMMIPAGSGFIINLSSVVGFKGYVNQSAYTATKHGVMGLTKSLAAEVQEHGICVSAILPGGVDTDFIGAARPDLDRSILIPPEDIAKTVLFMLSLSDRTMVDQIYIRRRTGTPF
ncbi:MAG: SDR family oxidoreductase [Spirochaetes bacterium]|nr:SDR family oxidoreductase [Spirochaetota bacterium]